jgi:hypothetical protein
MNAGERDEILAILTLIHAKGSGQNIQGFGAVSSVGFRTKIYSDWRRELGDPKRLQHASDEELEAAARLLAVSRARATEKADVYVNGLGISLKSHRKAPPALVNHTTRPGWEFAAKQAGVSIASLDQAVAEYWRLRTAGLCKEDVLNDGPRSPFWAARSELAPMLRYFMFEGTGMKPSVAPASAVFEFADPADIASWRCRQPETIVGELWTRLVFSLRSSRGMPRGYPNVSRHYTTRKPSIARWTVYWQDEYRGALHVRVR